MTILEAITSTGHDRRSRSQPGPGTQEAEVSLGRSFAVVLLAVLTILSLSGVSASAGDTGSLRYLEIEGSSGDTDPASGTWTLAPEPRWPAIIDTTYNRQDVWVDDIQMGGTTSTDTACSELDNPAFPHDYFLGEGSGHISVYDDAGNDRDISLSDIAIQGHADFGGTQGGMEITGSWKDPFTGRSGYFFSVTTTSNLWSGDRLCYANGWTSGYHEFYFLDDNTADIDAIDLPSSDRKESEQCQDAGGDRIVDSTAQGVRTFVYTYQPTGDQVWVCARVEDTATGEGYGGRLEATPADADPQVTGGPTPSTDSDSTACTTTTPNDVPGSHPISSGGVGSVDYMVDAYADNDEAWVCLQVGSSDHRVVVPLGSGTPDVQFGTVARWYPDEGTPGS